MIAAGNLFIYFLLVALNLMFREILCFKSPSNYSQVGIQYI